MDYKNLSEHQHEKLSRPSVLLTGNLDMGFVSVGPFDDGFAALKYAQDSSAHIDGFEIVSITTPDWGAKNRFC